MGDTQLLRLILLKHLKKHYDRRLVKEQCAEFAHCVVSIATRHPAAKTWVVQFLFDVLSCSLPPTCFPPITREHIVKIASCLISILGTAYQEDLAWQVPSVLGTLTREDANVRQMILESMPGNGTEARCDALSALSHVLKQDDACFNRVVTAIRDSNPEIAACALRNLALAELCRSGGHRAPLKKDSVLQKSIMEGMNNENPGIQKAAVDSVLMLGTSACDEMVEELARKLDSPSPRVRQGASEDSLLSFHSTAGRGCRSSCRSRRTLVKTKRSGILPCGP